MGESVRHDAMRYDAMRGTARVSRLFVRCDRNRAWILGFGMDWVVCGRLIDYFGLWIFERENVCV